MYKNKLTNIHISDVQVMASPEELKNELPINDAALEFVSRTRGEIADIIHGKDHRLLVICGPCSIHDPKAALEYAQKLKTLSDEIGDHLYIVMRAYFEKPRTTVGWKGLINDPHMDGSFEILDGFRIARKLLLDLLHMGLPLATEALDPITPQYLGELFSWSAIGARTTESQTHREMASGLSMPVGFKNGTDGGLEMAINAVKAAATEHSFLGINQEGQVSIVTTAGNPDVHVILRGGAHSNYDSVSIAEAELAMMKATLRPALMIDCSHSNSRKDYRRQPLVATDVVHQIREGNTSIMGIMLESNLFEGNQSAELPKSELKYGVSVTDACISFDTTASLLRRMHQDLSPYLKNRLK
ncbi:MAG: 3-deoxy-7-phosphoheptulonate synthase [Deltaproteobacteria bacterium]|nr:3-deoxy-7-phosphoheptulonate synthase [Deltaproteobacteria bacterium]MBN2670725.1 3-deoxy-7-phosphoheptulonate synthase [Deltaproteobacteria bacterium]